MGQDAHEGHTQEIVRTGCGREIAIGRMQMRPGRHQVDRITLRIGCQPYDNGEVWASLTSEESRALAGKLLAQAAAADRDQGRRDGQHASARLADPGQAGGPAQAPPGRVEVVFVAGESYAARVRGHLVLTDQPAGDGGDDAGPSPVELLVTSLATCAAYYADRYLSRHGVPREGLRVSAEFTMAGQPARVGSVRLRAQVPPGLPPERLAALRAMIAHCTVHNTLAHPPTVTVDLG